MDDARTISPGATHADGVPAWLIASLAGVLASGLGLAGWSLGGIAARDAGGLLGTLAGGVIAGVIVGRSRALVAAWAAAAVPLVLIALFVLPDPKYRFRELVQVFAASVGLSQGMYVAIGSAIGLAIGGRLRLGPARSTQAVAVLSLAAGSSVVGWLWFATTLWPRG
jgi:hypothetical protein